MSDPNPHEIGSLLLAVGHGFIDWCAPAAVASSDVIAFRVARRQFVGLRLEVDELRSFQSKAPPVEQEARPDRTACRTRLGAGPIPRISVIDNCDPRGRSWPAGYFLPRLTAFWSVVRSGFCHFSIC